MGDIEKAEGVFKRNQKVLQENSLDIDLNEDSLQRLLKMIEQTEEPDKAKLKLMADELVKIQIKLKNDFESKIREQEDKRNELEKTNDCLKTNLEKLKEKEKEFKMISELDRTTSFIYENEQEIQEIKRKIQDKKAVREKLESLKENHEKSIAEKKMKKKDLLEKQISLLEKTRKLKIEEEGKRKDLLRVSESFRDLETGRLEQSISQRSQFIFDSSSVFRSSPAKSSFFENQEIKPERMESQSVPPQKSNTTMVLISTIFVLLALIIKLLA